MRLHSSSAEASMWNVQIDSFALSQDTHASFDKRDLVMALPIDESVHILQQT